MILPPLSADCHMHVFGPFARFPLAPERAYNVAEAPLEAHERMKQSVGLERTVLVQASGHGFDNRAMLAALAGLGPRGRAVAVVPPDSTGLRELHAAGVRGVRLNLVTLASRHAGDPAHLISAYERMLEPLGWHLQVFGEGFESLEPALARCKVNVVIDHMGLPDAAKGIDQPSFQAVLRLAQKKHVWVKLAGADRITRSTGRLRDAIPFMRALHEATPERLVWGSDWPHLGFHNRRQVHGDEILPYRAVDARELLSVLFEAIPRPQGVLADNPARLYGFS
jgi:predicted TIM-barrel fold metal-dependent hydrolase